MPSTHLLPSQPPEHCPTRSGESQVSVRGRPGVSVRQWAHADMSPAVPELSAEAPPAFPPPTSRPLLIFKPPSYIARPLTALTVWQTVIRESQNNSKAAPEEQCLRPLTFSFAPQHPACRSSQLSEQPQPLPASLGALCRDSHPLLKAVSCLLSACSSQSASSLGSLGMCPFQERQRPQGTHICLCVHLTCLPLEAFMIPSRPQFSPPLGPQCVCLVLTALLL